MYVIKSVKKTKVGGSYSFLSTELEINKCLNHPNIVEFYEVYEAPEHFHLVLEQCRGVNLREHFKKVKGPLEARAVKKIAFDVLRALSYIHHMGIAHRNVIPENILLSTIDPLAGEIKLSDFGLAKRCTTGSINGRVGVPDYVAPEILKGAYDERSDIWSLGVIIYELLSGHKPFTGEDKGELFNAIVSGDYVTTTPIFFKIDDKAKAVIKGMLQISPKQRLTAQEALDMSWFEDLNKEMCDMGRGVFTDEVLSRIRRHEKHSHFKKRVLALMVDLLVFPMEVEELKSAFFYLDKLNNGVLGFDEFKHYFEEDSSIKPTPSDDEINSLIRALQLDEDLMSISFTEFIAGTIDK